MDHSVSTLLASEIVQAFAMTADGHCARVDYLSRELAEALCASIAARQGSAPIACHVLVARGDASASRWAITSDRAIELRNRKAVRLCLFVPSDLIDAAVSSLANAFALLDGRDLQHRAADRLFAGLSRQTQALVRAILRQVRAPLLLEPSRRLDILAAAARHADAGTSARLGGELWRIGLIADAGDDFATRLERNRTMVRGLAHPRRLHASVDERLRTLKLAPDSERALADALRGRVLSDVFSWSKALADGAGPTLDRWQLRDEPSDLQQVVIKPFRDRLGRVESFCKLTQPDGAGGALYVPSTPKAGIVVVWSTEPPNPAQVHAWRLEFVADGEPLDLPASIVPGARRRATVRVVLAGDVRPAAARIRVVALDSSHESLLGLLDRPDPESEEFFFADQGRPDDDDERPPNDEPKARGSVEVPCLPLGRLAALFDEAELAPQTPLWRDDSTGFSVMLTPRRTVAVELSPLLVSLQHQILKEPRAAGFALSHGSRSAGIPRRRILPPQLAHDERWNAFWRARDAFFRHFVPAQRVIEALDWSRDEVRQAVLRYASSYRALLDALRQAEAHDQLAEALALDTVLLQPDDADHTDLALLVLPIHPLRALWLAAHAELLRFWEGRLADVERSARRECLALDAVHQLVATNVPAFIVHPDASVPLMFYHNLDFFHGVMLPAALRDPQRRLAEIARIVGRPAPEAGEQMAASRMLASHIEAFRRLHPYARHLEISVVNLDQGRLVTDAFEQVLTGDLGDAEGEERDERSASEAPPALHLAIYTERPSSQVPAGLERLRTALNAHGAARAADPFTPLIAVSLRAMSQLGTPGQPAAHLSVLADLLQPEIVTLDAATREADTGTISVFGLLAHHESHFDPATLTWHQRIVSGREGRGDPHPVSRQFSDGMSQGHQAWLGAVGALLGGGMPAVRASLRDGQRDVLEQLHRTSHWVIAYDRYLGIEYLDSPAEPHLRELAERHIIDYRPTFHDQIGHRLLITTAWRDEIETHLATMLREFGLGDLETAQVEALLGRVKRVSGRLALHLTSEAADQTHTLALGIAAGWLQRANRLDGAILLPFESIVQIAMPAEDLAGVAARYSDVLLVTLRRGIIELRLVSVAVQPAGAVAEALVPGIRLRAEQSAQLLRTQFFSKRLDTPIQRAGLATVLRFGVQRARRHGTLSDDAARGALELLERIGRDELDVRISCEGLIVSTVPVTPQRWRVGEEEFHYFSLHEVLASESAPAAPRRMPRPAAPIVSADALASLAAVAPPDAPEPAPAPPDAPDSTGEPLVITLGHGLRGDIAWRPATRSSPHCFILGIPGQGKSVTTLRILNELARQRVPALVIDFHGQFGDPAGSYARLTSGSINDAAEGLPFSPFELDAGQQGTDQQDEQSFAIAEIIANITDLGPRQQDELFKAIRSAYTVRPNPTPTDVLRILERQEQLRRGDGVIARCRPILEMRLFRPGNDAGPQFIEALRAGMVLDLHKLRIEQVQLAAGAFALRRVLRDMFHWGVTDRIRLAIVLDEAHRLGRDPSLLKLMKEGRKYGIAVVVASQSMNDMPPDVLANAGTRILFRTNYPESQKVARYIRVPGMNVQERIEGLGVGQAFIQTPDMQQGTVCQMYREE